MYNKCTLSVIEVKEGTSVLFRLRLVQSRNISVRWAKYKSNSCTCINKNPNLVNIPCNSHLFLYSLFSNGQYIIFPSNTWLIYPRYIASTDLF